uniref:UTP6 small subunit processome component n=1 Tax=Scophthalmus maximus TaxID=52904 RepID=A0A8D3ECZ9_SCOMX
MAEIVQQRIEDRIPELEQLERVGLFTKKEVKSIVKRATALEYKLHRLIVNKEDFIAYIQVERHYPHIHYQFKREEIEFPIIHRINSIFRRATNKWKDDVQLWLSHVAFCKKWATKGQISKVFSAMLAIHPDKPALWIMAAKNELEDRNSSESARHLFLRALRFHPENKKVYQEYFRMELLHCEKLRKQKKELEMAEMDLGEYEFSAEILSGKLAEVVYRDATGKIKEAEFVISLLNTAAIFDFTKELQDSILQDLQTNYTEESLTWDFMAKRELEAPGAGEELQTAKGRASDINRREERCCQVYEEGVTKPMWTCYVTFCLERLKRKTNVQELKENVRNKWLKIVAIVFLNAFQNESASQTVCFLACCQRGLLSAVAAVAMEMKQRYLDWSYSSGGYKKSRKTFTSLQENRPLSKAFFTRMIEIEKEQETPKMNNLRDYYERALQEFGTTDDDLWLQYIQEELRPSGQPENCGKIHWRAMKFLEGESVERFTSKYTLLQTGHL